MSMYTMDVRGRLVENVEEFVKARPEEFFYLESNAATGECYLVSK